MARFRKDLRPVNSKKHIIDQQGGLVIDTVSVIELAEGVDSPSLATVNECAVGSTINSIFLNVQVAATSAAALANVYMLVYKNPSNGLTYPKGNAVGSSDVKKTIFHQEMLMVEKINPGIPRTLFKGVLKLPRHMRRMGQDDSLIVQLYTPGVTMDFCVQCIYKEFR